MKENYLQTINTIMKLYALFILNFRIGNKRTPYISQNASICISSCAILTLSVSLPFRQLPKLLADTQISRGPEDFAIGLHL